MHKTQAPSCRPTPDDLNGKLKKRKYKKPEYKITIKLFINYRAIIKYREAASQAIKQSAYSLQGIDNLEGMPVKPILQADLQHRRAHH